MVTVPRTWWDALGRFAPATGRQPLSYNKARVVRVALELRSPSSEIGHLGMVMKGWRMKGSPRRLGRPGRWGGAHVLNGSKGAPGLGRGDKGGGRASRRRAQVPVSSTLTCSALSLRGDPVPPLPRIKRPV